MQNSNFQFTHPKTTSSGSWAGCLITWQKCKSNSTHLLQTRITPCNPSAPNYWNIRKLESVSDLFPVHVSYGWADTPRWCSVSPNHSAQQWHCPKFVPQFCHSPVLTHETFPVFPLPFPAVEAPFVSSQASPPHTTGSGMSHFLRTKSCRPISLECINSIIRCIKSCACRISLIPTDIRSHI